MAQPVWLALLEAADLAAFPAEFQEGMAGRAAHLGDVGRSDPARWVAPFTGGGEVHAVLVQAADDPGDLEARHLRLLALLSAHGVSVVGTQPGDTRPGDQAGHEHFGFKDGISQPSIQGFTTSSKGGASLPAGEFIIGYPDADGKRQQCRAPGAGSDQ